MERCPCSSRSGVDGQPDRPALCERLACERGVVSFGELMVAVPMMLTVLIAVFVMYNVSTHSGQRVEDRVRSLAQEQSGLERMQRELRQATSITPISSQVVDMDTYVTPASGGIAATRWVRYDCTAGSCSRYEGTVGATSFSSGPVTVIANVLNSDVFGMEPDYVNPHFVSLNVDVSVSGATNPIVLTGGVALKNQARES